MFESGVDGFAVAFEEDAGDVDEAVKFHHFDVVGDFLDF